jgi:hypothetical protein
MDYTNFKYLFDWHFSPFAGWHEAYIGNTKVVTLIPAGTDFRVEMHYPWGNEDFVITQSLSGMMLLAHAMFEQEVAKVQAELDYYANPVGRGRDF